MVYTADILPGLLHHKSLRTRVNRFIRISCVFAGHTRAEKNACVIDGKFCERIAARRCFPARECCVACIQNGVARFLGK